MFICESYHAIDKTALQIILEYVSLIAAATLQPTSNEL